MIKVTKDKLKELANDINIDMNEDQYDSLLVDFQTLVKLTNLLTKIEGVDKVQVMVHPFDITTIELRDDIPTNVLSNEEVLLNAPKAFAGQIVLPKVVK